MNDGIRLGHISLKQCLAFFRRLAVSEPNIWSRMTVADGRNIQHVGVGLQPKSLKMGHQSCGKNDDTGRAAYNGLT